MTLISAFNIGQCPVVVGDLLLSGPELLEKEVAIPVIGDVTRVFPKGSGWSIVGLRQKVNLVANNCVVAWADSELAATIVIKDLRTLSSEAPLSFDRVVQYFQTIDPCLVALGVNIVGWVKDDKGFKRFCFNAETTKAGIFGEVSIAGSGTVSFLKFADGMPGVCPAADRVINPLEEAVSVSLMSVGLMLQSEFHTQETLLNYFGGGYEIASFVRDKFSKIGDITFICWTAEFKGDLIRLNLPVLALKQDYVDDILLIRSVRFQHLQDENEPSLIEESHHAVLPLYISVLPQNVEKTPIPEMNSKLTCHCILVQSDGSLQVLVRLEYRASGLPTSIVFNELAGELKWTINQEFVQGLAKSIQKQYRPNFVINSDVVR